MGTAEKAGGTEAVVISCSSRDQLHQEPSSQEDRKIGGFQGDFLKNAFLPPPNTSAAERVGVSPSPLPEEARANSPCSLKQQLMPDPAGDLDHSLETPNRAQRLQSQNK